MSSKTLKDLKSATPGDSLWDKENRNSVAGLHLRVFQNYKAWFVYYRTHDNIQRRPKIGNYPEMSLQEAREIAAKMKLKVANGEDPSTEKQDRRDAPTVHELFEQVCEKHWSKKKFRTSGWAKKAQGIYEREIKRAFGSFKVSQVRPHHVREWHESYEESAPVTGNRARAVLSKLFSYAIEREMIPQNTNPCTPVKLHDEEVRDRVASPDELKNILQALEREKTLCPKPVAFLSLLLLTGARPSALERARWDQLSYLVHEGACFGLITYSSKTVRGKTKQEVIALPPRAVEIVKSLPKESDLIFGIKMPRYFWERLRTELGCKDLWARDSRRTFGSVGLSEGEDLGVISDLLNHKTIQTTKRIYAKTMEKARLTSVQKIAQKMEGLLHG